jgi:putative hydrolases of HD superfamily
MDHSRADPTADEFERLVEFVSFSARLHGVTRNNMATSMRHESVAEHSWHLALVCLAFSDMIQRQEESPVDLLKMLKMCILHDLVEIDCGDPSIWEASVSPREKHEREDAAARHRFGKLPEPLASDFLALWDELGEASSREAQIVHAIDRLNPALMRYLTGQGWSDVGATVEALDEKQLPKVSRCEPMLRLYHWVRHRAVEEDLFSDGSGLERDLFVQAGG